MKISIGTEGASWSSLRPISRSGVIAANRGVAIVPMDLIQTPTGKNRMIEKFGRLQALLSHSLQENSYEMLFEKLSDLALEKLYKAAVGAGIGKCKKIEKPRNRYLSPALRDEIFRGNRGGQGNF